MAYSSIDRRRLDIEIQQRTDDREFKNRDLNLKSQELELQRQSRFTPVTVAVIAGFAALGGTIFGGFLQGRNGLELEKTKHQQSLDLEKRKLQSTLIAKATETPSQDDAAKRLKFLIDLKLITDENNELLRLLNQAPQDIPINRPPPAPQKPGASEKPLAPATTIGKYDSAISKYQAELQLRPNDPDLLNYLGYALFKRGNYEEAIQNLEKSLRVSKRGTWQRYNLALVYLAANRNKDAFRVLSELVTIAPEFKSIIKRDNQYSEYIEKFKEMKVIVNEA